MAWKASVCNEMLTDFSNPVRYGLFLSTLRDTGFHGVEIAPYSVFGDFSGNSEKTARELKKVLDNEGLSFAGFHWLLASPDGLHIGTEDERLRKISRDHLFRLSDLASELGGGVLVLGSPAQRSAPDDKTVLQAEMRITEMLISIADRLAEAGNRLLLESVDHRHTNVFNTLDDVRRVLKKIDHPAIGGMFDFNNCSDEQEEWPVLIEQHKEYLSHVHLNAPGGGHPQKDSQWADAYRKSFGKLVDIGYSGWVSLEIFENPESTESVLRETREFLNQVAHEIGAPGNGDTGEIV